VPDIPPEIREAAHAAARLPIPQAMATSPRELVDLALDAAAPLLAEAVAARILAHMEAHGIGMEVQLPGAAAVRRAMRRSHFRIAAQVAARAFTTEAESRQQAAEAIMRGDFMACDIPEDPGA
jgi:hypothetical protein